MAQLTSSQYIDLEAKEKIMTAREVASNMKKYLNEEIKNFDDCQRFFRFLLYSAGVVSTPCLLNAKEANRIGAYVWNNHCKDPNSNLLMLNAGLKNSSNFTTMVYGNMKQDDVVLCCSILDDFFKPSWELDNIQQKTLAQARSQRVKDNLNEKQKELYLIQCQIKQLEVQLIEQNNLELLVNKQP